MNVTTGRYAGALVAAILGIASCEDFGKETFLGKVHITRVPGAITAGDSTRYFASAEFENSMSELNPVIRFQSDKYPDDWAWISSNASVASINAFGAVRAVSPGTFRMSATFRNVSDTLTVVVVPVVHAVVLSPTSDTVDLNGSVTFDATAVDAQQQPLPSVPFSASVIALGGTGSNITVTSSALSATTTRFTVSAKGGVQFPIVVSTPNVRPDRVRSATYTIFVNP